VRILQRLKKTAQYFRNLGVDDPNPSLTTFLQK